jgi:hypothetical protein
VLRDRRNEPARREAWLRDQYRHPEEHRHTLAEVQRWFEENGIDYMRAYPSALVGEEPGDLFAYASDNWLPESLLAQVSLLHAATPAALAVPDRWLCGLLCPFAGCGHLGVFDEIFPTRVRAKGQSLGSSTPWVMNALISGLFPILATRSAGYPILFFCCMVILQFFVVFFFFPETKGVTLEQMQQRLEME